MAEEERLTVQYRDRKLRRDFSLFEVCKQKMEKPDLGRDVEVFAEHLFS